jgi:hypothetical protein
MDVRPVAKRIICTNGRFGSTSAGCVLAGCEPLDCRRWAVRVAKLVSWSGTKRSNGWRYALLGAYLFAFVFFR